MRMSRWEWLARWFQPAKRTKSVRPKREKPAEVRTWIIGGLPFHAFTRSEARAQAKKKFGYRGRRLPPGTIIVEEKKKEE